MSLFGTIMSKIFHHPAANAQTSNTGTTGANAQQGQYAPTQGGQQGGAAQAQPQAGQGAQSAQGAGQAAGRPAQPVDVEAVLNQMAQSHGEKLNWRTSIVDLMKLVGLDSSLAARKSLAQELNYTGDTNDSATMNIWLHKQVMTKLAENGGKVPADLRH